MDSEGGRSSSPGRVKSFLLFTSSRPVLGPTQPPIQWVSGALSPEIKRPGREINHSPPSSAEVKKTWIYKSAPPIRLHGGQLFLLLSSSVLTRHEHILYLVFSAPITVAARSKALTDFARSNAGSVASNPIQDMDICVRLFCV
jgi:hypothetical protein